MFFIDQIVGARVADLDHFESDPCPTFHLNAAPDPDPTLLSSKAQLYLPSTSLVVALALYVPTI
jgi:hypothetical protein